MIWIELIGPSGVGKSYWYEKFMKQYPFYEPKQLVLNRIYKSDEYAKMPLKLKVMFWLQRLSIYRISKYFQNKLFSYFLKNFEKKSKNIYKNKDEVIIKSYLENVNILNEPQIVILKKISHFHQKLREFKFYQFYLNENDIYISEDGLMHLAPVFISDLQPDRIFIFQKNFHCLVNQRLRRAKATPTTYIEFLLNKCDLEEYIIKYYEVYASKIKEINQIIPARKVNNFNLDDVDVIKEMYQEVITCDE